MASRPFDACFTLQRSILIISYISIRRFDLKRSLPGCEVFLDAYGCFDFQKMSNSSLPKEEKKPNSPADAEHDTLKYHLLGPSLLKAGQDSVDQKKVCNVNGYPNHG